MTEMIVCQLCQLELRTILIGVDLLEIAGDTNRDGQQFPYKLHRADVLQCPGCGHTLIMASKNPYAQQGQEDFMQKVTDCGEPHLCYESLRFSPNKVMEHGELIELALGFMLANLDQVLDANFGSVPSDDVDKIELELKSVIARRKAWLERPNLG